jgi:glucan phosphoethanolaminetransferase (alkaline phosphatase superfamily)
MANGGDKVLAHVSSGSLFERTETALGPSFPVRRLTESLALTGVARFSAVALALLTGIFFLLSSFTFSWLNIIRNENLLWIARLGNIYPVLYWVVVGLNAITLIPAFYRRKTRWWIEAFLIVLATIGMAFSRVYSYDEVPLSFSNVGWTVATTLPLAGFGLFDIVIFRSRDLWRRQPANKSLPAWSAFLLGIFSATWYFAIAVFRYRFVSSNWISVIPIFLNSVLLHAFLFTAALVSLSLVTGLAERAHWNVRIQFMVSLALIWIFSSLLLRRLVTPALAFNNWWADAWSWSYPFAFVVLLAGWHIRRAVLTSEAPPERVEEILSRLAPSGLWWTTLMIGAALLCAVTIPMAIERVDWNFLFQRLNAIGVWLVICAMGWRLFARPIVKKSQILKNSAVCILSILCGMLLMQSSRLWHGLGLKAVSRAAVAYNGMDASFQVAQIAFRPVIRDSDHTGLFAYLLRNALIADPIRPPKMKLAASLSPTRGFRADIYIIVVDTLRRDYLSPYNPQVKFTPQIESFSKSSFVFQHAYTNYGGTALSEPAIWAGMMIPSKHYVEPFSEMNALEQMTTIDGYRRVLTRDMILRRLLRRFPSDVELNVRNKQYPGIDLRDAVRELIALPASKGQAPLFVYTQPQNIHPVTLQELSHSGERVQGDYRGFNARYADELRKVDEAFGLLIDDLKAKGTFDNSIVILTSDHGDWLGEYGRWGHGQSLLSPIIEVPLLIHLPESLSRGMHCNTSQMVFLTDIAPTLYYLLGHRDLRAGEFYGRPLFTESASEQKDYGYPDHLFMSAYAPVFGLLEENTQKLYVADAVDKNQSLYDLNEDHYGLENHLDPTSQPRFEKLMRAQINRLNELYGYTAAEH